MPRKKKNVPMEENGKQEDAMKYEFPINEEENVAETENISKELDALFGNNDIENDPFMADPFGNSGFGNDSFMADPFGNSGFGNDSFMADPFENSDFGSDPFGADPFENNGFGNSNYPFEIDHSSFGTSSSEDVRRIMESAKKNIYSNRVCDMNEPFAFISYTHSGLYGNCFVMAFFEYFYNKFGYNLWIDYANLPKNESHWNVAARKAIFSRNCKMVLFFRNEFSTINRNVYKELELAKSRHIPIIPIDFWQFSKGGSDYRNFLQENASADSFLEFENIADIVSIHANAIQAKCKEIDKSGWGNMPYTVFYKNAQEAVESIARHVKTEFEQNGLYDKSTKNIFQMLSRLEEVEVGSNQKERKKIDRHFFQLNSNIRTYDMYNRRAEIIEDNENHSFAVLFDDVYSLTKYSVLFLPEEVSELEQFFKNKHRDELSQKAEQEMDFYESHSQQIENFYQKQMESVDNDDVEKLIVKIWNYLFVSDSVIQVGEKQFMLTKDFPPVEKFEIGNQQVKIVDNRIDTWSQFVSREEYEKEDINKLKAEVKKKKRASASGYSYRVNFTKINRELLEHGMEELSLEQQRELLNNKNLYKALILGNGGRTAGEQRTGKIIDGAQFAERLINCWDQYDISSKFEPEDKEERRVLLRISSPSSNDWFQPKQRYLAVLIQKENGEIYLQSAEDYFADREKYKFVNGSNKEQVIQWTNQPDSSTGMIRCKQLSVNDVWWEETVDPNSKGANYLRGLLDLEAVSEQSDWLIYNTAEAFDGKVYKNFNEINENDAYRWWHDFSKLHEDSERSEVEKSNIETLVKEIESNEAVCAQVKDMFTRSSYAGFYCYDGELKEKKKVFLTSVRLASIWDDNYEITILKNTIIDDLPNGWKDRISEDDLNKIQDGVVIENVVFEVDINETGVESWLDTHAKYLNFDSEEAILEIGQLFLKCK